MASCQESEVLKVFFCGDWNILSRNVLYIEWINYIHVTCFLGIGGAASQLSQIPSVQAQQGAESVADSEFDMFAQARNVTYETSKKGSVEEIT